MHTWAVLTTKLAAGHKALGWCDFDADLSHSEPDCIVIAT